MEKKLQKLLNKGFTYLGMISEAKIRCTLLKNRIIKGSPKEVSQPSFVAQIDAELKQIQNDLATYTQKLECVYEDLKKHGITS
jgi:hypothetical protein